MGKPSRQRRSRLRMTKFNLSKSNQLITIQQNVITNLQDEIKDQHQQKSDAQLNSYFLDNIITDLQKEILQLTDEISQFPAKLSAALESQKFEYSKKHKTILTIYSDNLNEHYRREFNKTRAKYMEDCNQKLKNSLGDIT